MELKRKGDPIISANLSPKDNLQKQQIGWLSASALALGGSNLSLFIIASLISGQNSAGILLLIIGIITSWMAIPCWMELLLIYPNRVGGIAANTSALLKKYDPVLANINGVAYWSCTVLGISLAALFISTFFTELLFPTLSVYVLSIGLILFFMFINMSGIKIIGYLTVPLAMIAFILSLGSAFIPIFFGNLSWVQALSYQLTVPFDNFFGTLTAIMGGLYLIAFSAPAFEQGLCYMGEMRDPIKNLKKLFIAIIIITFVFYILLPLTWHAALGIKPLTGDYIETLAFVYSPLFKESAKFFSASFMITNSFVCLISSLSCSSRTMLQLAEDGLVPKFLSVRSKFGAPFTSVIFTSFAAILLLFVGSPTWLLAATNFEYTMVIILATVIVYIMRKWEPDLPRPYRASNVGMGLGLCSALIWLTALTFGFQQFGLIAMLAGFAFPFSGLILYIWRMVQDRYKLGKSIFHFQSLQVRLTGTIISVLILDAIGYLIAVYTLPPEKIELITALEDIFVVVALLTIAIGLLLPAKVARTAISISNAAKLLVAGTLSDFAEAMNALGKGELEKAKAEIKISLIPEESTDEIGEMAHSFNQLQKKIANAATGLEMAREGLQLARTKLISANIHLDERVKERTKQLESALVNLKATQDQLVESAKMASLGLLVAGVAHEVNTPLGVCITCISQLKKQTENVYETINNNSLTKSKLNEYIALNQESSILIENNLARAAELISSFKQVAADRSKDTLREIDLKEYLFQIIFSLKPVLKENHINITTNIEENIKFLTYPSELFSIISILVMNSIHHGFDASISSPQIIIDAFYKNNKIYLYYIDNGKGISEENLKKIFDPFFTTRRNQQNAGLGLSIAYNTVTQLLKGTITCESKSGQGIKFTIIIPLEKENIKFK